jgi:excisionase family DNA binding protein
MKYVTMSGGELELGDLTMTQAAFLQKIQAASGDVGVTSGEFIALAWGRENPILDTAQFPDRALVTATAHALPFYGVMADLLGRKQEQQDGVRFTMTVQEAADVLEITEPSVRAAIGTGKLSKRQVGGRILLDPAQVATYPRRAPNKTPAEVGAQVAGLQAHVGSKTGASFRIHGADVAAPKVGDAREGPIADGWTRIAVLASKANKARCFLLEPAEGAAESLDFEGFYIRGPFRIVERINNTNRAHERFGEVGRETPRR